MLSNDVAGTAIAKENMMYSSALNCTAQLSGCVIALI